MTDPTFTLTFQELWRIIAESKPPSEQPLGAFGPYQELIDSIRGAYVSEVRACQALGQPVNGTPTKEARQTWDLWSTQADYADLMLAMQEAAASRSADPHDLGWLRDQLALIPKGKDGIELRQLLNPALNRIIDFEDEIAVVAALEELRRYFKWKVDTFKAYRELVVKERRRKQKEAKPDDADALTESEELGESTPPPLFLSPALAAHEGVVYISHKMAFKVTRRSRRGAVTTIAWKPVIITSDRRRLVPQAPPLGADPDSVWWLDEAQNLALSGGFVDAPSRRWSYDSIVGHLHGHSPTVAAHEVYDALMMSLKRYVYHADEYSYVVDVLWAMGTYFYRLWNAYPYLALHGEKGAGKTTFLTWLSAVCFNAEFVVNTSEASLYRSIQAKAPTLLIDEQEGLNSSKAAKETKADLMGILKSGYKTGAQVARQRMDRPELTEYFDVYSPKALAAIELFEDVLENRAILTFMTTKPASVQLDDDSAITTRQQTEFSPLRDQLYLLLMQQAANVSKLTDHVRLDATNRFRELFKPLYVLAMLVDMSRGKGKDVLTALQMASEAKAKLRTERDLLTPESMLREALMMVIHDANDNQYEYTRATILESGLVLADTLQIKEAFDGLFSDRKQSFFNDHWLGKQAQKIKGMHAADPRRRRREVKEFDPATHDEVVVEKRVVCYLLDPKELG